MKEPQSGMTTGVDLKGLSAILGQLKGARLGLLALSIEERAEAISKSLNALDRLPEARLKVLSLEMSTSAPALRWALATARRTWGGDALPSLFKAEIGSLKALDSWVQRSDGPLWRAFPPELCLHIQASNLGVPGLEGAIFALFLGAPCLVKLPRSGGQGPLLQAFKDALASHAPEVGQALEGVYWPGGDEALEALAFASADVCLFQGGDQALGDIRRRLPPSTRLVAHPNRFSASYIDATELGRPGLAQALVEDICRYDQLGCLSPRGIFLRGSMEDARQLMSAMDDAFKGRDPEELTPLSLESQGQLAQLRGRLAFTGAFVAGPGYGVGVDPGPFRPAPTSRVGIITPVEDLQGALGALEPYRGRVQGVALGVGEGARLAVAEAFAEIGVPYITEVGAIQRPVAGWPADGRPLMGDLLRVSMFSGGV